MAEGLSAVMLNPVRMRIVQAVATRGQATASDICAVIGDVPRTTTYRHIGILVSAGVLTVVAERRVRGTVERTLAVNTTALAQGSPGSAAREILQCFLTLYTKFERYVSEPDHPGGPQTVFLNNTVLMMSDPEFDRFLADLRALLTSYHAEDPTGRRPRDLTIISAPVESDGHDVT